jgi:hypothetical protein
VAFQGLFRDFFFTLIDSRTLQKKCFHDASSQCRDGDSPFHFLALPSLQTVLEMSDFPVGHSRVNVVCMTSMFYMVMMVRNQNYVT